MGELCEGGDTETDRIMRYYSMSARGFSSREALMTGFFLVIKLMDAAEYFRVAFSAVKYDCYSVSIKQSHPIH
jgi:hypothetical protein